MASNTIVQSSSSASHVIRRYDVFVSFRGEDTRNNFTGFLFEALRRKGIAAFKDDTDLKKGESIAPELIQAIESSHIFIVVLSKNYASSTWCLRELAKILSCIETSKGHVLPIFYDVDPSEVRKESGYYEKAFAQHEERFKEDKEKMEEVQRWKEALTQVANLSGWDIRNNPQHVEIEEIVQKIINILGPKFSSLPNDGLVGMEYHVEELEKLLCLGSNDDVRVVGISGMGGIGKSTLGHALYERISHQYDFRCFIDDISKIYRESGTLGVQKQLICQSLNENNLEIRNVSEGTYLAWTRLRHARALVVLDNVDQVGQLRMFTGSRDTLLRECLGGGSKIIIISRDEHILRTHGVDDVYRVQPLNRENAHKLFCKEAFKDNYLIMSDYEKLKYDLLSYVDGNPLAIKVLGSFLFGLDSQQWKSALARLKESPDTSIMNVLRISFDGLHKTEKEIFLDLACFLEKYSEIYVREVLDFRGFHPEIGLKVLVDKSLISIGNGYIQMNSLLKELGRNIVQEKSPKEPRMWSRLWDVQDLSKVMSDNMEAENLEAIHVPNYQKDFSKTTMRADALSKMRHLKWLELLNVNFSGSLDYLSNEIGYLTWNQYPFECLPPSFQPENLVELYMSKSEMKHLWKGTKPLHNLRLLSLNGSENLIEIPDLGEALNLEGLGLQGCIQLKQLHPSIGLLRKLTELNLKDCRSLVRLPCFGEGLNLELLNLEGCIQLRKIDPSIGLLSKLAVLKLKNCKNLESLPTNILGLNSLEYLSISGCTKLYNYQLVDEPRDAKHLKKLRVGKAPIHSQSIISNMTRLFSRPLDWLPTWLFSGAHKDSFICLLHSSPSFPCMRELDLSFCNLLQIPNAIGNLGCLERLNLRGNNFDRLPSLRELSKLYYLNLTHCKQFKYLIELPLRTDLPSKFYMTPNNCRRLNISRCYQLGAGLWIFNCPEFVKKESCTRMTISWLIQIFQAKEHMDRLLRQPNVFDLGIRSVIPGSEIPRWFHNQREGNLISIDTPPDKLDNNLIGVMCCAVFVIGHERGSAMNSFKRPCYCFNVSGLFDNDPKVRVIDELGHICLTYDSVQTLILKEYLVINFIPRNSYHVPGIGNIFCLGNMEVEFLVQYCGSLEERPDIYWEAKKCGYHWVYEQDLRLPDVAVMHSENLSNLKRKFLEIEEV